MAVSAILFFVALGPAPAQAHPYLVQTLPGPGAIVQAPPPAIEIGFTESVILEGSSIRLEGPDREPIALGPLRRPEGGPGLTADVEGDLAAAVYTVRWVVLGDDGHTSSGEFAFGVSDPEGRPPPGAENLSATGG
ncbi:MAG TPA: copper resistance protein CopC, partial [Acidimicrobiia bacterium]|nr:copper resistance protein CopC [Acidimicrobiia bacterium]